MKSGSLNLLEPSGPVLACNGIEKKNWIRVNPVKYEWHRYSTKSSIYVYIYHIETVRTTQRTVLSRIDDQSLCLVQE